VKSNAWLSSGLEEELANPTITKIFTNSSQQVLLPQTEQDLYNLKQQ